MRNLLAIDHDRRHFGQSGVSITGTMVDSLLQPSRGLLRPCRLGALVSLAAAFDRVAGSSGTGSRLHVASGTAVAWAGCLWWKYRTSTCSAVRWRIWMSARVATRRHITWPSPLTVAGGYLA